MTSPAPSPLASSPSPALSPDTPAVLTPDGARSVLRALSFSLSDSVALSLVAELRLSILLEPEGPVVRVPCSVVHPSVASLNAAWLPAGVGEELIVGRHEVCVADPRDLLSAA